MKGPVSIFFIFTTSLLMASVSKTDTCLSLFAHSVKYQNMPGYLSGKNSFEFLNQFAQKEFATSYLGTSDHKNFIIGSNDTMEAKLKVLNQIEGIHESTRNEDVDSYAVTFRGPQVNQFIDSMDILVDSMRKRSALGEKVWYLPMTPIVALLGIPGLFVLDQLPTDYVTTYILMLISSSQIFESTALFKNQIIHKDRYWPEFITRMNLARESNEMGKWFYLSRSFNLQKYIRDEIIDGPCQNFSRMRELSYFQNDDDRSSLFYLAIQKAYEKYKGLDLIKEKVWVGIDMLYWNYDLEQIPTITLVVRTGKNPPKYKNSPKTLRNDQALNDNNDLTRDLTTSF